MKHYLEHYRDDKGQLQPLPISELKRLHKHSIDLEERIAKSVMELSKELNNKETALAFKGGCVVALHTVLEEASELDRVLFIAEAIRKGVS